MVNNIFFRDAYICYIYFQSVENIPCKIRNKARISTTMTLYSLFYDKDIHYHDYSILNQRF